MSKKDYVAIADMLNRLLWDRDNDPATMAWVIAGLSELFAQDNPRFDKDRFNAACTAEKKS